MSVLEKSLAPFLIFSPTVSHAFPAESTVSAEINFFIFNFRRCHIHRLLTPDHFENVNVVPTFVLALIFVAAVYFVPSMVSSSFRLVADALAGIKTAPYF